MKKEKIILEKNKKITEKVKKNQSKRKKVLSIFFVLIILVGAVFGLYWYFYASHYISTDNAYTDVEIAQVTPSVGGTISDVLVTNTQVVKKGDILVKIDQTDTSLAVEEAKANLSLAIRRVKGYMANNNGLNALIEARKADEMKMNAKLSSAKADFKKAQIDLKRREDLISSGAISADELTIAGTKAVAPGKHSTAILSSAQALESKKPGSEMPGVPASEITAS